MMAWHIFLEVKKMKIEQIIDNNSYGIRYFAADLANFLEKKGIESNTKNFKGTLF